MKTLVLDSKKVTSADKIYQLIERQIYFNLSEFYLMMTIIMDRQRVKKS